MNQTSGESAVGKLKTKTANISRLLCQYQGFIQDFVKEGGGECDDYRIEGGGGLW